MNVVFVNKNIVIDMKVAGDSIPIANIFIDKDFLTKGSVGPK